MNCPHCNKDLTPEQIKKLWAMLGGSAISEAKSNAAKENGKKGGRPKKATGLSINAMVVL